MLTRTGVAALAGALVLALGLVAGCGGGGDEAATTNAAPVVTAMPTVTTQLTAPTAIPDTPESARARAEATRKATATKARARHAARARARAARAKQARTRAAARVRAATQARARAARAKARTRVAQQAPITTVYAETDPEYLLGSIDHGINDGTDPRLRQYAKAITKLEGACGTHRMRIADRATSIMNSLDEQAGVKVTTLEVLQGVGIASEADVGWSCEDLFVGWAIVREAEE